LTSPVRDRYTFGRWMRAAATVLPPLTATEFIIRRASGSVNKRSARRTKRRRRIAAPDSHLMPTLAVDFDGTIAHYKGWAGRGVFLPPLPGAADALRALKEQGWNIVVFTCRTEEDELRAYLVAHGIPFDAINVGLDPSMECSGKVYADIYLDDRAVTFRDWAGAPDAIQARYDELAATHALDYHVPTVTTSTGDSA